MKKNKCKMGASRMLAAAVAATAMSRSAMAAPLNVSYSTADSTYSPSFSGMPLGTGSGSLMPTFAPVDLFGTIPFGLPWYYFALPVPSFTTGGGSVANPGGISDFNSGTAGSQTLGLLAGPTTGMQTFGFELINSTSSTLNSISLSYTGALWRQATGAATLNFGYLVDSANPSGDTLPVGGTTPVSGLNVSFLPTGPTMVGGAGGPLATSTLSVTNLPISGWTPGAALWLTWQSSTSTTNTQGLGIRGLSFSAVAAGGGAANVTWANSSSMASWDTTSPNWTGGSPTANLYKDGDNVTFSDTNPSQNISIPSPVSPGSTTISNATGSYAFTGSINGSGSLTKTGNGTAYFSSANNYSGGTFIKGGAVAINGAGQLGTGAVTFGGGTLFDGGQDVSSQIANSTAAIAIDTIFSATVTFASSLPSSNVGGLTKYDSGILTLSAANSYTGPTSIEAGVLKMSGLGTMGATTNALNMDLNGQLDLNGTNQTVGAVNGTGISNVITNNLTGTTSTFTIGSDGNSGTFTGFITDGADNSLGTGKLALIKTGGGTEILAGTNNYSGTTSINQGAITVFPDGTIPNSAITVGAGIFNGTLTLQSPSGTLARYLSSLNITTTGTVNVGATSVANSAVLVISTSGFTNAGKLDLTNNSMIVQGTSGTIAANLTAINTQLQSGFNAGHGYWDGLSGIVSSQAASDTTHLITLGFGPGGNPIDGVNTTANDVLIKYTYYGDADLNGVVNGADYALIDTGFGMHLTGWYNGDFNYDGVVDGTDYSLIDNTFNQITATSAAPLTIIAGAAVPEPTTLGLIGITAISFLNHRRRRGLR